MCYVIHMNTNSTPELPASMSPAQKRAYRFGFTAGERGRDLDTAERAWANKPRAIETAWRDGYTDGTAGFAFGDTPRQRAAETDARIAAARAAWRAGRA